MTMKVRGVSELFLKAHGHLFERELSPERLYFRMVLRQPFAFSRFNPDDAIEPAHVVTFHKVGQYWEPATEADRKDLDDWNAQNIKEVDVRKSNA